MGVGMWAWLLVAAAESQCGSVAECNALGTAAYQAGAQALALAHFERQVDFAETALADAEDDPRAAQAVQLALNNAALSLLRGGRCARAAAYLEAAEADHPATRANRRQWQSRCASRPVAAAPAGEYWQYAGHGGWNSVQVVADGDAGWRATLFWMRAGHGPLVENGPAAFGSLESLPLAVQDGRGEVRFEGDDGAPDCRLALRFDAEGVDLAVEDDARCQVGGAGAWLGGRYRRVESAPLDAAAAQP